MGPQMQGPGMKAMNVDMNSLKGKLGSGGGQATAPSGPLLPSQGVFKQMPWLPWWLVPVGIALAALAVMLYLLLPKNTVVPDVVGKESTFAAEETLTDAGLKLGAAPKEKVDPDAPAGSILSQTPKAGEKAEKETEVTVESRWATARSASPTSPACRCPTRRPRCATRSSRSGSPTRSRRIPKGKIETQIPAADEIVPEGKPVDVFFADPNGKKGGDAKKKEDGGAAEAEAAAAAEAAAVAARAPTS